MARKSGKVTLRLLASMALALNTCSKAPPKPLPAEAPLATDQDGKEKRVEQRPPQPGCGGMYYYPGGCGYSNYSRYDRPGSYGAPIGYGTNPGTRTGGIGLHGGSSTSRGTTTSPGVSVSRGGFGSSGASHGVAS